MSLDRELLRSSISHLFSPATMPRGPASDCVREWLTAYSRYAQGASAAGTVPSALIPVVGLEGMFFESLDSALRSMWTAVAWLGPGLTGVTLMVPPLGPILSKPAGVLIGSRDPGQALTLITEALHTYTLGISVTVTPPIGAPVIALLT